MLIFAGSQWRFRMLWIGASENRWRVGRHNEIKSHKVYRLGATPYMVALACFNDRWHLHWRKMTSNISSLIRRKNNHSFQHQTNNQTTNNIKQPFFPTHQTSLVTISEGWNSLLTSWKSVEDTTNGRERGCCSACCKQTTRVKWPWWNVIKALILCEVSDKTLQVQKESFCTWSDLSVRPRIRKEERARAAVGPLWLGVRSFKISIQCPLKSLMPQEIDLSMRFITQKRVRCGWFPAYKRIFSEMKLAVKRWMLLGDKLAYCWMLWFRTQPCDVRTFPYISK